MKVLFACFHPVDPHVAKNLAFELIRRNHNVLFVIIEKENIIEDIVKSLNFPYLVIGKTKKTPLGKVINIITLDIRLFIVAKKFKPDLIFSPASPNTGHVSKLLNIHHVCWGDTETATVNLKFSLPFIDSLLLPDCFYKKVSSEKIIHFMGYKEIAYLHPNWFTPEKVLMEKIGINATEKVVLLRFSALKAMHDIGLESVVEEKSGKILRYIIEIEKYARVFISMTEKELGIEFQKYRLPIPPVDYANFLANCTLYIGEGTTTASEAGVLGVPWINIQSTTRGYLIEQEEKYKLGFRTDDIDYAFDKAIEWLQDDTLLEKWKRKKIELLKDKIDVSAFFVWFIENYPESHKIMKLTPEYQLRFRYDE